MEGVFVLHRSKVDAARRSDFTAIGGKVVDVSPQCKHYLAQQKQSK